MVKNTTKSKERYGKVWQHIYQRGKPALKHKKTGQVKIPSDSYVKKHHPRGPWDS